MSTITHRDALSPPRTEYSPDRAFRRHRHVFPWVLTRLKKRALELWNAGARELPLHHIGEELRVILRKSRPLDDRLVRRYIQAVVTEYPELEELFL